MKILILTLTISEKSGLGRYSLDLIRELAKNNELIIYTFKKDKELNFSFPSSQICYIFPGDDRIYRLMRPWLFLKYLVMILPQARKVDLIHSFMDFPYSFLALIIGKLARKPVIATAHGTYSVSPFFSRRWSGLLRWVYRHLDKIVCVSNFTKKEILKNIDVNNCEVINNGINLDKFKIVKGSSSLIPPLVRGGGGGLFSGKKIGEKMILSVGMLKYRKGFHVSLKAVARVREEYQDLKYYIVCRQSDKDYFEKLKKIVRDYNLEDLVVFLENISDKELIWLYNEVDLFLLTPIYVRGSFEGFGLVYLEASACGKPVVGTLGSGAEDAIIHNKTGLLVPENNPEATAQAAIKILKDPELAATFGKNGQEFARKQGWDKVARRYEEVYQCVLER